jgi:hypothetical protein
MPFRPAVPRLLFWSDFRENRQLGPDLRRQVGEGVGLLYPLHPQEWRLGRKVLIFSQK